jgi:acetyl-CoA carboxylase carboxyl transferase subunit alpha
MRKHVMDFERPLVELEQRLESLRHAPSAHEPEIAAEISELEEALARVHEETYRDLSPWAKVQISRHPDRPRTLDYVDALFDDFIELHGDRAFADDGAIVGGPARYRGRRVMVIGHQKGKSTKENVARNFGSPHPEGFRKARRLMGVAERFGMPLVLMVDTAGAYPGAQAEERGVANAIAMTIEKLTSVRTPVAVAVIGEGGSGGALAIGFGDRILMLENSYYSVSTPEVCASILWRDQAKAAEAAEALRLTAQDLKESGIVDTIVGEPVGGAQHDPSAAIRALDEALAPAMEQLAGQPVDGLLEARYARLRAIGEWAGEAQ